MYLRLLTFDEEDALAAVDILEHRHVTFIFDGVSFRADTKLDRLDGLLARDNGDVLTADYFCIGKTELGKDGLDFVWRSND